MSDFEEGVRYYAHVAGSSVAAGMHSEYTDSVRLEIQKLLDDLEQFSGNQKSSALLKGDVAEFFHTGTFNIRSALHHSEHRVTADRSNEFASADYTSNFGQSGSLKYYSNGELSAKQQAQSIFERYSEYRGRGGKLSFEKYRTERGYTDEAVLNDPIYSGQVRIIPADQIVAATEWLKRKIATEAARRPEQVWRYQETLDMLTDAIRDNEGNSSVRLTKEQSEKLAILVKTKKLTLKDLDELTDEKIVEFRYIAQSMLKAGLSAALITVVLRVVPEIWDCIKIVWKEGSLDDEKLKEVGVKLFAGGADGFVRGVVSAAITDVFRSGALGDALRNISPAVVASAVVCCMDTLKNAYRVVNGTMNSRELADDLAKDVIVSACSMGLGAASQAFIEVPVLGYMIGSFIGSLLGSFVYQTGYSATLSLCLNTGFTMFGLVEQDYTLPKEILEKLGVKTVDYQMVRYKRFEPERVEYKRIAFNKVEFDRIDITVMRRGIIGVRRIGYCG